MFAVIPKKIRWHFNFCIELFFGSNGRCFWVNIGIFGKFWDIFGGNFMKTSEIFEIIGIYVNISLRFWRNFEICSKKNCKFLWTLKKVLVGCKEISGKLELKKREKCGKFWKNNVKLKKINSLKILEKSMRRF